MANNNNEGADNNPDNLKDSGSDKSFVGKFVSGILNSTPLSKWFGKESSSTSFIRRREEDEEYDMSYNFQPPTKRAKLPSDVERNTYDGRIFESPVTVHASNNVNSSSTKVFGKFPEPAPGPSGIKSRKLFEKHNTSSTNTISTNSFENHLETVNGEHDSDSGESTSGYSSAPKLIKKPKSVDISANNDGHEKVTPRTRSLFTPTNDLSGTRTLFSSRSPQMNTSLSSRRPSFNASTFGSPNFVDRTLSTKRIMNSPFYSGNTIYGGASAYGRRLSKNADEPNVTTRTSVQIKPINEKSTNENTTLSKTARRILSTLEQYSTPINDAKKIPVAPRKPGLLSTYIGATPYLVRDRKRPSNKELQVPSVPDLLQMKQKERLQNSTETVRQIAAKSKSSLNKEEYKLRTEEDNKQKYSNKMKSSVASVRQKIQPAEPVSEVKLPKVSLPITTLPKFDFVLIPPSSSAVEANKSFKETNDSSGATKAHVSTVIKPTVAVENKETEKKTTEKTKINHYTFSEPVVISKDLKPVTAINCFKFSEPLCKKEINVTFKTGESSFKSGGFKLKNNGENANLKGTKPASQLLTGSVMDVLGKKNATPSQSNNKTAGWECPTCLEKNDADKINCCACDEPKPQSQLTSEENKGFGDQFKLSSDKWECNSCLVRNNVSDIKCVACGAAKPNQNKQNGFGDKFKPPVSTWECTTCLIRNKNELDTCAACGTTKLVKSSTASNFGDKFKPSGDTWECSTCMIRNKNDLQKCAACETPKPGSKIAQVQKTMPFATTSSPKFSFGIKSEWECKTCMIKNNNELKKCAACDTPKDSEDKKGFGDVFKIKTDEWECSSCMVRNKSTADVCVCCGITKPGSSGNKLTELSKNEEKKPVISFNFGIDKANATQFKFGIPTTKSEVKESVTVSGASPAFTFGDPTKAATTGTTGFTFGVKSQEKVPVATSVASTTDSAPTVATNPLLKLTEKLPEKATPAPVGFKFGLDTGLNNQSQTSRTTKSETPAVTFSSSVSSAPIPTFQFKPPATNGDISKPKENATFGGEVKPKDSVLLGNEMKPKDSITFGTDTNKPNIFASDPHKPKEVMFGDPNKTQDSPFGKPNKPETSFTTVNKPADLLFGVSSKTVDSPFGSTNKLTDSPFSSTSKPTDSPFGNVSKATESPFGNVNKTVNSPFGSSSKPTDSPFGQSTESPFRNVNKPMESPFGKVGKPSESPFANMTKPSESPFGNMSDKPKESLFGTPKDTSKPQSTLFGGVNDGSKPQESLFSSDANKPKDVLFGNKPAESGTLFPNPTSTPAFSFAPKPLESTTSTFPSTTSSQPGAQAVFKFGSGTSPNPMKKPFGDSSDNMSNGFGSSSKIPAFGPTQGFGTSENKPFAFGSAEAASKNPGFSFAQTDKSSTAPPVFNFGGSAPSTSTGGFNFSVPSTGFNFGGAPKVENQPFNAPSTSVFGPAGAGAKNGSFNFGTNTNNNNQKAVFSFGGNQTTQPSQPSFPTQAPPGFSFGPPASMSGPPGTFNFAGAPSTFNFTDGSSAQSQTPRKIKRAIRRTQR